MIVAMKQFLTKPKTIGAWLALGLGSLVASGALSSERISFVVPETTIYPGQSLNKSAFVKKPFYITESAANQYVLSADQVAGKVARRTLLAGKPVLLTALEDPSIVKRGVLTPLIFSAGSLLISTVGVPLEPGAVGDLIKIRNGDSGVILSGTVLADGRVQVGTP